MSALAGVPVGSTASVRQLRVAGTGLQPRLHDKTTRRTDPAGSTLATPDFGPKDGVHLRPCVTVGACVDDGNSSFIAVVLPTAWGALFRSRGLNPFHAVERRRVGGVTHEARLPR